MKTFTIRKLTEIGLDVDNYWYVVNGFDKSPLTDVQLFLPSTALISVWIDRDHDSLLTVRFEVPDDYEHDDDTLTLTGEIKEEKI